MNLGTNVRFIPATKQMGNTVLPSLIPKTRVAAYCRVSTENEEQESSYEIQVQHYKGFIESRHDWDLVDIYADEGISGTNTLKRDAFNRMIADCDSGKIDLIITKSISRFSRNTVDCLRYTRKLKAINVGVFFEKENINTLETQGETLMTILAALAQQESESLSANVRLGIQFRNQQGKVQVNHNRFLGYTKDKDGKLVIVPEEAEVVKRIYREYLEGASMIQIKRGLEKDGILNGAHSPKWYATNIRQILTNEKYIGDALLQKTYTVDILEKKRAKNNGFLPKYYVEGSQAPIIDKEAFMRVQAEMARRANIYTEGKKRTYSGRFALSGIVFCGNCGDIYRRVKWNNRGVKSTVWRCTSRLDKDGPPCTARTLKEEELHKAVIDAVNDVLNQRDAVVEILEKNISDTLNKDVSSRIAAIDRKLDMLQQELLKGDGDNTAVQEIGNKILMMLFVARETKTNEQGLDTSEEILEIVQNTNNSLGSVDFGKFEQDGNHENGKEPITWIVLAKEETKMLLISEYGLSAQSYNINKNASIDWGTCSVRRWLNNTFLEDAFSDTEQKRILDTEVAIGDGKNVTDKLFLLSDSEFSDYFYSKEGTEVIATQIAVNEGARVYDNGYSWWWLRTRGHFYISAMFINEKGSLITDGRSMENTTGVVRPALWISLE